jgi:riboflavin synthase
MFTGIITAVGTIAALQPRGGDMRLRIATGKLDLSDVQLGDSIAVSGVCLTAIELPGDGFWADASRETLELTILGEIAPGMNVNLEKALTPTTRLGGHLVSGHVDGIGTVSEWRPDGRSWRLRVQAPDALARYIAAKGSICVDGVSLTVNRVDGAAFELNIVPHTLAETTLVNFQVGRRVNLEVDLIARYLERLLIGRPRRPTRRRSDRSVIARTRFLEIAMALNSIDEILTDFRQGKMVIIMDDEDRENEGDLLIAASLVRPEDINFMARYGRGLICLPLTRERCQQLRLPLMVQDNSSPYSTNFTVSIEAAQGVTTGISAYDRAHTIRTAVRPDARPEDLVQPGHIFPADGAAGRGADSRRAHRSRLRSRPIGRLGTGGGARRNPQRRRHAWPGGPIWKPSPNSTA